MKISITENPYSIYVYGSLKARATVCRDLQRLGLSYSEVGSCPEEAAKLSPSENARLVVALGPEDKFGQIVRELTSQNEKLQPYIWRDIEFFSELLTHAQVEDASCCPEPECSAAVGMNIDFVLGGAETWATQLFFALKEKLVPQGVPVQMWEPRQQSSYLYVGREFYGITAEDVIQFGMFDGFLDYTLAVMEQLIRQPPALFFDNGSMQMLAAFYLAKRYLGLKTRILSVLHGDFSIFLNRATRCQEVIDSFVAVSDNIAERLHKRLPHREPDISVYLQLPPEHPESLKKKHGHTPLRVAYAARLEAAGKRSLWLMDVMDGLAAAGVDFELSIAGDGECYEPLKQHIEQERLEDRVHLLGRIPHQEMDAFYEDKDVFVNFSVSEGGPLTLFESLSHGVIPVVTEAGCAKRFIRQGENGFLIDSPQAAVEVLKDLAGDVAAYRALGEKALTGYLFQREQMKDQLDHWLAACGLTE